VTPHKSDATVSTEVVALKSDSWTGYAVFKMGVSVETPDFIAADE